MEAEQSSALPGGSSSYDDYFFRYYFPDETSFLNPDGYNHLDGCSASAPEDTASKESSPTTATEDVERGGVKDTEVASVRVVGMPSPNSEFVPMERISPPSVSQPLVSKDRYTPQPPPGRQQQQQPTPQSSKYTAPLPPPLTTFTPLPGDLRPAVAPASGPTTQSTAEPVVDGNSPNSQTRQKGGAGRVAKRVDDDGGAEEPPRRRKPRPALRPIATVPPWTEGPVPGGAVVPGSIQSKRASLDTTSAISTTDGPTLHCARMQSNHVSKEAPSLVLPAIPDWLARLNAQMISKAAAERTGDGIGFEMDAPNDAISAIMDDAGDWLNPCLRPAPNTPRAPGRLATASSQARPRLGMGSALTLPAGTKLRTLNRSVGDSASSLSMSDSSSCSNSQSSFLPTPHTKQVSNPSLHSGFISIKYAQRTITPASMRDDYYSHSSTSATSVASAQTQQPHHLKAISLAVMARSEGSEVEEEDTQPHPLPESAGALGPVRRPRENNFFQQVRRQQLGSHLHTLSNEGSLPEIARLQRGGLPTLSPDGKGLPMNGEAVDDDGGFSPLKGRSGSVNSPRRLRQQLHGSIREHISRNTSPDLDEGTSGLSALSLPNETTFVAFTAS